MTATYKVQNALIGPKANLPAAGDPGGSAQQAPFGLYICADTAEIYVDNGSSGWVKLSDLGVTAASAAADFAVTGNETVGGTLGVTGASTLAGVTATTVHATGAATLDSTVAVGGNVTVTEAKNIVLGTVTGTKIGTATSQKIGFFNAAPVAQQSITGALSTVADAPAKAVLTAIVTALANLGLGANGTT